MTLEFPHVIDSTMRADFVACHERFRRAFVQNLHPSAKSVHLHFGQCFARGLEATRVAFFQDKRSAEDALAKGFAAIILEWGEYDPPPNTVKTLTRCLEALDSYFQQYPLETEAFPPAIFNTHAAVECSFAVPLGIPHPVDGEPLLYGGRFDSLCKTPGGAYFILDDKTASQLGESWLKQWRLRGQFTGYVWGSESYGVSISGVLVRGVGILKTQTSHAQVIEQRENWLVQKWLVQLRRDVEAMIRCWRENYWDYNYDKSCSDFGGCPYLELCQSPHPERWENQFVSRKWEPLKVNA